MQVGSPSSDAEQFSERFVSLMNIDRYKPQVLDRLELTYSAVFSQALDRLLFERDAGEGCVLYHPILFKDRSHSNRPDCQGGLPAMPTS